MADYLIHDSTLEDIADAIRAKTGGSSLIAPEDMPTEIASISGGTSIDHGLEYTLDSSGVIVGAKVVGDTVPPYAFSYGFSGNSTAVVVDLTGVKTIGSNAFNASNRALIDFSTCEDIEVIKANAFRINANTYNSMADQTVTMPKLTGVGSSEQIFYGANAYFPKVWRFPQLTTVPIYFFYGLTQTLVDIQFGSIGTAVTSSGNRPFGGNTAGTGTVTVYTTGSYLDKVKTRIQEQAVSGLSFVYKASEATTYNGTTYNAGDTMLTV